MALIIREGVGPPMRRGFWSKVRARFAGLRDQQRLFGELVGVVAAFVIVIMRQWRKVIDGRFLDAPVVDRPNISIRIITGGGGPWVSKLAIMVRETPAPNIAIHMRYLIDPQGRLPDGGRIIGAVGYVHSLTPQVVCGC